jgi:hypothetical protein
MHLRNDMDDVIVTFDRDVADLVRGRRSACRMARTMGNWTTEASALGNRTSPFLVLTETLNPTHPDSSAMGGCPPARTRHPDHRGNGDWDEEASMAPRASERLPRPVDEEH